MSNKVIGILLMLLLPIIAYLYMFNHIKSKGVIRIIIAIILFVGIIFLTRI
ncbi:hypothetical protein KST01_03770 [Fusobacterium animalis]|jgi:hypothetical protein|uniref:hypothetical protein n=1 Tax=Fusobacterium TaxID=848 RepID=UPI001EF11DCD|nr:hypothetical protein [Fusobacterium nucleatum]MCG6837316.1 hypothetical protein [Fusobacterium nucleatum]